MPGLNRRHFLGAGAATLAIPSIGYAQEGLVKIGALAPRQGGFAEQGDAAALGFKIALDMAGNKVLGRPVRLIMYDDPDPAGAEQNIRKLVEEDKVCAVMGGNSSASGLAIAAVGAQLKVPTIVSQAGARDITGKACNSYVFRTNAYTEIFTKRMAKKLLPLGKRWYFLVGAYAFGDEIYQQMRDQLLAAGGTDLGKDATPIGTTDFSSLILKMRQAKPDVIVLGISSNDLSVFLKQYKEFGQTTSLAAPDCGDEELWNLETNPMRYVGKPWHWNDPANTAEERMMNDAFSKVAGHPASLSAALAWASMRMMLTAIELAGSLEPLAIVRGLEDARPSGVRGYYRRWDHQMLWGPVLGKVREKITDKYDPITIVDPLSVAEIEALYPTQTESECKMTRG